MHKNFVTFMQSVVVFPVITATLALSPATGVVGSPTAAAIFSDQNRPLTSETLDNKQELHTEKVKKVEAYFDKYDLPLAAHAEKLVTAAEENDLPWQLLASMAMIESTGGKFACNNGTNPFGWNSCKGVTFTSVDEAIDTVASTLAGKNPSTARYYEGKSVSEKLVVYNGRGVNPHYVKKVTGVMNKIDAMEVPVELAVNEN